MRPNITAALAAILLYMLCIPDYAMAIEKPTYTVLETHGEVEIRRYEPMKVAKTRVDATFDEAGNIAFRRLAGYIFGDNRGDKKISMTAPVMQYADTPTADAYWITFMMPAKYEMDELPRPNDRSVILEQLDTAVFAAIRYRGGWSEEKYRSWEKKLIDTVDELAGWKREGVPMWARYNPPMMPPWFRTNEILVRVLPAEQQVGD